MEGLFGNEAEYDSSDRRGFDIIIDDDILMGKVNLASTQTKLKSKNSKN